MHHPNSQPRPCIRKSNFLNSWENRNKNCGHLEYIKYTLDPDPHNFGIQKFIQKLRILNETDKIRIGFDPTANLWFSDASSGTRFSKVTAEFGWCAFWGSSNPSKAIVLVFLFSQDTELKITYVERIRSLGYVL